MEHSILPSALERQRAIYLKGAAGLRPIVPFSFEKLEKEAARNLSPEAFAYIAGGAGNESTMRSNCSDFDRWKIQPRMMRDVSEIDLSVEIFGKRWPSPLLTAPIGVLEMAHSEADLAVARAAASLQIPMIFSNQASVPMEKCAAEMGQSPRWMQLYWSKSNELVANLARRAEACGCSAIVLTADTTMLGWRTRDLDLASLPFLKGMGIAQYTSDPVFQKLMLEPDPNPPAKPTITVETIRTLIASNKRHPGPFFENLRSGRGLRAVRKFTQLYTNPALNWSFLEFLRQQTSLPILLKGILHPDDARLAIEAGASGIYVSNHGGRQVDGSISAIAALPAIAAEVAGRVPIIIDSGIRGGADVFKCLALGASAVAIGRPYCYGLALAGEAGVREVLLNFLADFELTMRLSGCRNIAECRLFGEEKQRFW